MPADDLFDASALGLPDDSPLARAHFQRVDERDDRLFYRDARMVTHIDDEAIAALRAHYGRVFPANGAVLDLMSSCVSHFPRDFEPSRAAGLGMNADELAANHALTERVVHDINREPTLPYSGMSFDVVAIAVSVQYLRHPVEVFREIRRVLKPDAICAVSFSNRRFPTKAIALWTRTGDAAHVQVVSAYFHYAGGFRQLEAFHLSPNSGNSDPLYVVQARRDADTRAPTRRPTRR